MSDFFELRRVMDAVMKRWWFIVVMVAVSAAMSYLITKRQTPVYQATTTVLIGQSIELAQLDRVDIQTSEALVQTYVEMAQREPVLEGVVNTLELNGTWQELRRQVEVQPVDGTQLIEIVVESDTPDGARRIADEVAHQLLLISPESSTGDTGSDPVEKFNRDQLMSLQERILNGQRRLEELQIALESATSESELAALQREKTTLEGLIVDWERNYAELLPFTSSEPGKEPNRLTVIETAYSNNTQVRPNLKLNTLLGGAIGLAVALGIIIFLEFLDETYRSADDLFQSEGLEVLGSVGRIRGRKHSDKIITRLAPFSALAESYRIIRNRLHLEPDGTSKRSIMVTSAVPQEGKSLTVANLGIILAEANIKTVIVDADLRRSTLHLAFDLKSENGLADLLRQPGSRIEDFLKATPVYNLHVLTSGKIPSNPSELLGSGSRGILKIINDLKQFADVVILDSPPASVFSDTISLSNLVDDVILVVRAGKTKKSDIKKTLYNLQNNRADFLGCIFNYSSKENTYFSRQADYYKPRRVPSSSDSERPATLIPVEQAKKDDFDYLAIQGGEELEASALNNEADVFASEAPMESADAEVIQFDEMDDSTISTVEILEAPDFDDESAGMAEVPMPGPGDLTTSVNVRSELADSEGGSPESRTTLRRHRPSKSFKKPIGHSKKNDRRSGEDASD